MQENFSSVSPGVPLTVERRRKKRYEIDFPVTALTPGRGKKRTIGCGRLHDIGDGGARFSLDHPMKSGELLSLEVHFSDASGEVTDIRFRGIVKRVVPGLLHEIAMSFFKGATFVRRKESRSEGRPRIQMNKNGNWIN